MKWQRLLSSKTMLLIVLAIFVVVVAGSKCSWEPFAVGEWGTDVPEQKQKDNVKKWCESMRLPDVNAKYESIRRFDPKLLQPICDAANKVGGALAKTVDFASACGTQPKCSDGNLYRSGYVCQHDKDANKCCQSFKDGRNKSCRDKGSSTRFSAVDVRNHGCPDGYGFPGTGGNAGMCCSNYQGPNTGCLSKADAKKMIKNTSLRNRSCPKGYDHWGWQGTANEGKCCATTKNTGCLEWSEVQKKRTSDINPPRNWQKCKFWSRNEVSPGQWQCGNGTFDVGTTDGIQGDGLYYHQCAETDACANKMKDFIKTKGPQPAAASSSTQASAPSAPASDWKVTVYSKPEKNKGGGVLSQEFSERGKLYNMKDYDWNDAIAAIDIPGDKYLHVYSGPNQTGQWLGLGPGYHELQNYAFPSGQAHSGRICEDATNTGCWNRSISSIYVAP